MKKLRLLSIAVLFGSAIMFSSCRKDGTSADSNIAPVNFDAAYIVNSQSNSISIVILATNKVDQTIDLASLQSSQGMMGTNMGNMWPYHISMSPDKSKLVIAAPGMDLSNGNYMMQASSGSNDIHSEHHSGSIGSNSSVSTIMPGRILVLDAITGELIKEITLEGMAMNAIFSPDGKELWTTLMMTEGKVLVFDATTYALLNTITVGQMPTEVSFSDDGKKAFVANGMSGSVTVIDTVTKQILETIVVGNDPVGVWPGMGGMMYVNNAYDQSISIINSFTNMMTNTLQLGFTPGMAVRNTMMNQMWVSDPDGSKIHMWTKSSTGYIQGGTVTVGNGASAIAFNKAGTTCYVTNQNDGTVSVVDVASLKEMMKITVGKKPNGIVIRNK